MRYAAHLPRANKGFSLVELMIAVTIGLLILTGLTTLFVNNSSTRLELERNNRQIENGRYAVDLLTTDLRLAGFYAELDPTALTAPATMPDPCTTAVDAAAIAKLIEAMPVPIQGYDNYSSTTGLTCLANADVKPGTDIVVVRHTSTCIAGNSDCDPVTTGIPYFQASLCNNASELNSPNTSNWYALDTDTNVLTRKKRDCTTKADIRRYRTHIYFIASNNNAGDGIPTLKRLELDNSSSGFSTVALAEGIENLQIEYGLDTTGTGTVSAYTTDPGSYGGCTGNGCITNWQNVVSVKLHLLARNTEKSSGYTDNNTYYMGFNKDGTANNISITDSSQQGYKRHVYQTAVSLSNIMGRRAQ